MIIWGLKIPTVKMKGPPGNIIVNATDQTRYESKGYEYVGVHEHGDPIPDDPEMVPEGASDSKVVVSTSASDSKDTATAGDGKSEE